MKLDNVKKSQMNKVCGTCGGSGSSDCMVTCSSCRETSEHVFCMRRILRPVPKVWRCDGCTESLTEAGNFQLTNSSTVEDNNSDADRTKTPLRKELVMNYGSSEKTSVNKKTGMKKLLSPKYGLSTLSDTDKESVTVTTSLYTTCYNLIPTEGVPMFPSEVISRTSNMEEKLDALMLSKSNAYGTLRSQHSSMNQTVPWGTRTSMPGITISEKFDAPSHLKKREIDFKTHHSPSKCLVLPKSIVKEKDGTNLENEVSGNEASHDIHGKEIMGGSSDEQMHHALASVMEGHKEDNLIGDLHDSPLKNISPGESMNAVDGELPDTHGIVQPLTLLMDPDPSLSDSPISAMCWEGTFHVSDTNFHGCFGIQGHFSHQVSYKAVDISKKLDSKLKFNVFPRQFVWPKIFHVDLTIHQDVAIYFLPSKHERSKETYMHLMEYMNSNDLALQSHVGNVELLIYSSKQLSTNSQSMAMYLCGVFRKVKRKSLFHSKLGAAAMSNLGNEPNNSIEKKTTENDGLSDRANMKTHGLTPVPAVNASWLLKPNPWTCSGWK